MPALSAVSALQGRPGRRQPGDRDAERRARHVVQADLVEELDRGGVTAVLPAHPGLQGGLGGAALLDADGDQLAHAVPELSTHENQRVTKALDDAIQAAVNGSKKPDAALKDAQREADRILRRYQK